MTALSTYRHGSRVGNVRVPSLSSAGASQTAGVSVPRSNVPVSVYQSNDENFHVAGAAAPTSILRAVRRQEPVKENTMKPGVWTAPINKQSVGAHKVPSFTGKFFFLSQRQMEIITKHIFYNECLMLL